MTKEAGGAKAFGGLMAIAAIIMAIAAIMLPMHNRLSTVEKNLKTHTSKLDHPVAVTKNVEHHDRLIRLLWQRVYDEPLPGSHE